MIYLDGSTYVGNFANNLMEGYGEFTWANGVKRRYKGAWKNNVMHG